MMTWQQQQAIKRWFWKRRTLSDRLRIVLWRVRQDGPKAFRSGLLGPPFGRQDQPAPRLLEDPQFAFLKTLHTSLETPRLQLTPMETSDLDDLINLFPTNPGENPTKPRYWTTESILTRELLNAFQTWVVRLQTNGECIGHCGLTEFTIEGVIEPEIGYRIGELYQGQGFATEAAAAVRDLLFAHGVDHAISAIAADNTASQRVAQKNGMRWEKRAQWQGRPVEIYGISRESSRATEPKALGDASPDRSTEND